MIRFCATGNNLLITNRLRGSNRSLKIISIRLVNDEVLIRHQFSY